MRTLIRKVALSFVLSSAMLSNVEAARPAPQNCNNRLDDDNDGYVDAVDIGCLQGSESLAMGCNPTPDPTNLIFNGHLECPGPLVEEPDHWKRLGNTAPTDAIWMQRGEAQLGGTYDGSRVLKVISSVESGFTASWSHLDRISVEPDTWYEFSADVASDRTELRILSSGEAWRGSFWTGAKVEIIEEGRSTPVHQFDLSATATGVMDQFDPVAGAYRTHKVGSLEPWRRLTMSFRTGHWDPQVSTVYCNLFTIHYPKGVIYFDNFAFRKNSPNQDSTAPPAQVSGTLNFVKHKGSDFFPIVLFGTLKNGSASLIPVPTPADFSSWRSYVGNGFNTAYFDMKPQAAASLLAGWPADLGLTYDLCTNFGNSANWLDDPLPYDASWTCPAVDQDAVKTLKSLTGNTAARDNVVFAYTRDEVNSHPAEAGAPMRQLETLSFARDRLHDPGNFPTVPVIENFGGLTWTGSSHTGAPADLIPYLKVTDVFTHTSNLPPAYPGSTTTLAMWLNTLGGRTRRSLQYAEAAREGGVPKPHLAFALGVREWANWDGDPNNPNTIGNTHPADQYIPFNLQRYLVYAQLIAGATGVWFHLGSYTDVSDPTDAVFLEQVRYLAEEIASLEPVLRVPAYDNKPVTVSDPRIEYMLKKYNDGISEKWYLFTASSQPADIVGVQFKISAGGLKLKRVTALRDVANGAFRNPVNRTLSFTGQNIFTDNFIGEDGSAGQYLPTPGYAVHVYMLEFK